MTIFHKIIIRDNTQWAEFIMNERNAFVCHNDMERYKADLNKLVGQYHGKLLFGNNRDIVGDRYVPTQWIHGIEFETEEDLMYFILKF